MEEAVVRGLYEDFERFEAALRTLKERGVRCYEAYGPTNLEEIEDLMPSKGSRVRVWDTSGAIIGLATFWIMCVTTSLIYGLIVGGKPPVSNVPFIIPAYEGTILTGSIMAFLAILWYASLGPRWPGRDYDPRFSEDRYGIDVHCSPGDRAEMSSLLRDAGAVEVIDVR